MFRRKRPVAGPLVFFAAVAALALSGLACAKKEVEDSWQMEPPVLEMKDAQGSVLKIKSSDLIKGKSKTPLFVDESALLQFAKADQGLRLQIQSRCEDTSKQIVVFTEDAKTSEAVALAKILPPLIYAPDAIKRDWTCGVHLSVMNAVGSIHKFSFTDMKMNLSVSAEQLKKAPILSTEDEIKIRTAYPRRLVCNAWWVESSSDDLSTMSRASGVHGIDTRKINRQPLCTVIELSPKPNVIGFFRASYAAPRIEWSRESLIPLAEVPDLYHRPLMKWNVRNTEAIPQIVFVSYKTSAVKIALLRNQLGSGERPLWFRPTLVRPSLTISGVSEFRETDDGFYFRLPPGGTAQIQMHSNRSASVYSAADFTRPIGHILLGFTTEKPIVLSTLAHEAIVPNLLTADAATLASFERDMDQPSKNTLLSSAFFERDVSSTWLREKVITAEAAFALGDSGPRPDAHDRFGTPVVD